ncbi:DUF4249 domain-containing protein [Cesiribacter sp. SM1]|uniref:DUF4249 domain-containing protein n=1 Tax=Cesiribacter sp. SM1 TaxID=2861196 RepID=UPI001CD7F061|nr:DUF4249 domain-containing protein [Cesiribacter sp. SM1]
MIKHLKTYMLMLALLLTGAACTDVIDVELPEGEPLLVVDGWIYDTPGPYTITLSTTAPYFGNAETPRVTGATVRIADNEGFTEELIEVAPGKYQTQNIRGKVGNTYTLSIDYDGESYRAVTNIKPGVTVDYLTYEFKEESGGMDEGYFLKFFGQELETEGDHYHLRMYQNDQYLSEPGQLIFVSDQMVDGNYIHDLQLNWEPFSLNDKVKLEMLVITEDTYQFLLELSQQINNGGMFPNPIANVRTNVVNTSSEGKKAAGYFAGASIDTIEGTISAESGVINR